MDIRASKALDAGWSHGRVWGGDLGLLMRAGMDGSHYVVKLATLRAGTGSVIRGFKGPLVVGSIGGSLLDDVCK